MNSKNSDIKSVQNEFVDLLKFKTDDEKLEFEAQMIHMDLILKIQDLMKINNIKTKMQLAEMLDTSQSYVTQLFTGEKLLNLKLLAKLQRIFNMRFPIMPSQYQKLRRNFMNQLANKGYISTIIDYKNIEPGYKKTA